MIKNNANPSKKQPLHRVVTTELCLAAIRFYQYAVSPMLGGHCRFEPTCSAYAKQAVQLHGPWKAAALVIRRIARCRPGGGFGLDPVPLTKEKNA